jgi:hypothetical protein
VIPAERLAEYGKLMLEVAREDEKQAAVKALSPTPHGADSEAVG